MKKVGSIIFVIFALILTGCSTTADKTKSDGVVDEKFMIASLPWGESWETIKDNPNLLSAKIITDDSIRLDVEINETKFLGVNGRMVLEFSVSENNFPAGGLTKIYFTYDDKDEQTLMEQGEKIYGERKNYFSDENGIENPINPPAWYSKENIEKSLTEEEKSYFRKILLDKNIEETRAEAILRGPLVVISVNENTNVVTISGDKAAEVKNLKEMEAK